MSENETKKCEKLLRKIESFDHIFYLIILFVPQKRADMVFCYQDCSDLLQEKLLKFETEGRELKKNWDP